MSKITCQICGAQEHSIQLHLKSAHPEVTIEQYKLDYPDAPILSAEASARIAARMAEKADPLLSVAMAGGEGATVTVMTPPTGSVKEAMHELFELGAVKAAMNTRGEPIPITKLVMHGNPYADMVPDIDKAYVYNVELLKTVLMGLELNIPIYLWGHAGTGKSSMLEQVSARTNRPYLRIQHTANTEESHIVGQMLANERGTYWEPGPLMLAMKHGWVYNADEYDYAHPSVHAVYQPVLEGKPLVTKEAPPEWRVVHPHKNFRFVATGNTNGSGDETGLYIGTNLGNAANYSRFGITEQVEYMSKKMESLILCGQAGLVKEDADKLVEFATEVRKAFDAGNIGSTIGPRELIYAGTLGLRRGSWRSGLNLAFINRLTKTDRETVSGIAQRMFE